MSIPAVPRPARAVLSVLSARWEDFWAVLRPQLEDLAGPIDYESAPIPFSKTSYYDTELGTPITRRLLSFARPLPMDDLPAFKLATNELEIAWTTGGRRLFNLDPGFITLERLILATGKNFVHRVYLRDGIWADLTLIYHKGGWFDLPWTFPDYASPEMKAHLTIIREMYKSSLSRLQIKADL